jgi:hypothetical protein
MVFYLEVSPTCHQAYQTTFRHHVHTYYTTIYDTGIKSYICGGRF